MTAKFFFTATASADESSSLKAGSHAVKPSIMHTEIIIIYDFSAYACSLRQDCIIHTHTHAHTYTHTCTHTHMKTNTSVTNLKFA